MEQVKRKTPWAFYISLILLLLLAATLLVPIFRRYQMRQRELARRRIELERRETENARLNREVDSLRNSPEAVEKVAREKFGLSRPGETILRYDAPSPKNHK